MVGPTLVVVGNERPQAGLYGFTRCHSIFFNDGMTPVLHIILTKHLNYHRAGRRNESVAPAALPDTLNQKERNEFVLFVI